MPNTHTHTHTRACATVLTDREFPISYACSTNRDAAALSVLASVGEEQEPREEPGSATEHDMHDDRDDYSATTASVTAYETETDTEAHIAATTTGTTSAAAAVGGHMVASSETAELADEVDLLQAERQQWATQAQTERTLAQSSSAQLEARLQAAQQSNRCV